ncbi:hypothetical protein Pst134EA_031751, partial [Puccinia striiformis f. sp. tritici]|uniref:uncharacterized protein n=1 Tax=Puccinia striiformis f. sp. tritici TaxID=168172 RepID=UPI0020074D0F
PTMPLVSPRFVDRYKCTSNGAKAQLPVRIESEILQQLKKTVFSSAFYNLMNLKFDDGFIKGTEEKYLQQLDSLILDLGNLHSGGWKKRQRTPMR